MFSIKFNTQDPLNFFEIGTLFVTDINLQNNEINFKYILIFEIDFYFLQFTQSFKGIFGSTTQL